MGTDYFRQMDKAAQELNQKLMDHIKKELAFFIEMYFPHSRIIERDLPIEYAFIAKEAIVRDLLATADEISTLPQYQILKQICDNANCAILFRIEELPFPNEGLILQSFHLTISTAVSNNTER